LAEVFHYCFTQRELFGLPREYPVRIVAFYFRSSCVCNVVITSCRL